MLRPEPALLCALLLAAVAHAAPCGDWACRLRSCVDSRLCNRDAQCCQLALRGEDLAAADPAAARASYAAAYRVQPTMELKDRLEDLERVPGPGAVVNPVGARRAAPRRAPRPAPPAGAPIRAAQPGAPAAQPGAPAAQPESAPAQPESAPATPPAVAAPPVPTQTKEARRACADPRARGPQAAPCALLPVASAPAVVPLNRTARSIYRRGWFWGTLAAVAASGIAITVATTWPTLPDDASRVRFTNIQREQAHAVP